MGKSKEKKIKEKQTRLTAKSLTLNRNVKCQQLYPVLGLKRVGKKTVDELKAFGIILDKQQAANLGILLLVSSKQWFTTEVTVYRKTRQVGLSMAVPSR
jgi:hypothetical protein